ncbi:Endoribonuclease [Aphelenchoides fujianensis]|nr:Endoribonuclease [Aphelenchoides fujianensis]
MTPFLLLGLLSAAIVPASSSSIPNFKVTPAAIQKLVDDMRAADKEKPTPCDVHLDYQQHYDGAEAAPNKLFKNVNADILKQPSFAKLLALRPFFNPQTGVAEKQTPQKIQAIKAFYDAVWASGPFQELIKFMKQNNHPWTKDAATFRGNIGSLWFDMFSRANYQL